MNSSVARDYLRANRRSNIHIYPDDWKRLPIADIPTERQAPIVAVVDEILALLNLDLEADITTLEAALDSHINDLYYGTATPERH